MSADQSPNHGLDDCPLINEEDSNIDDVDGYMTEFTISDSSLHYDIVMEIYNVSDEPEQPATTATTTTEKNTRDMLEAGPSSQYRDHYGRWRYYSTHKLIGDVEKKEASPSSLGLHSDEPSYECQASQYALPILNDNMSCEDADPSSECKNTILSRCQEIQNALQREFSPRRCSTPTPAFPCDSTTVDFGQFKEEESDDSKEEESDDSKEEESDDSKEEESDDSKEESDDSKEEESDDSKEEDSDDIIKDICESSN